MSNELKLKNINGYFEKKVTKFGTVDLSSCPKEYLEKKVIVVVLR